MPLESSRHVPPDRTVKQLFLSGPGPAPSEPREEARPIDFALSLGTVRVGSSAESDLQLPSELVSRQHALLTVTPEGVLVEDRGSTNGTFVDEHRITRAALALGATLEIGPYRLVLQQRDPDDAEVAIHFEPRPQASRPRKSVASERREASTVIDPRSLGDPLQPESLQLVGSLIQLATAGESSRASLLLTALREHLELEGAAVVGTSDASIVCREVVGQLGEVPSATALQATSGRALPSREPLPRTIVRNDPPTIAVVFDETSKTECSALVLWPSPRTPNWASRREFLVCLGHLIDAAVQPRGSRSTLPDLGPGLVFPDDYVPGTSPRMVAVYDQIRTSSRCDLPVIITGESGVGKEAIARIFHDSSLRYEGPFVAVNCAAIPADLIEAELFGVAAGAATGVRPRAGWLQKAEGGTLFLDEIGEMPSGLQSKLLRALQEGEVRPVGGDPRAVDVRILSATNVDLEEALGEGRLRADLYYRLAGVVVGVPPLRQRREDLPELVAYFVRRAAGQRGITVAGVTVRALRLLSDYPWPGNIRQLEYEMQRAVHALADGGLIDSGSLSEAIQYHRQEESPRFDSDLELQPRIEALESRLIREALRRTGGLQNRAAELLGLSRNGLAKKMKRLGIRPESGEADDAS